MLLVVTSGVLFFVENDLLYYTYSFLPGLLAWGPSHASSAQ